MITGTIVEEIKLPIRSTAAVTMVTVGDVARHPGGQGKEDSRMTSELYTTHLNKLRASGLTLVVSSSSSVS